MTNEQDPTEREAAATATADLSVVQAVEDRSGGTAAKGDRDDPDGSTALVRRTRTNKREVSGLGRVPSASGRRARWSFGLRVKFNAALLFAFGVGLSLAAWLSDRMLKDNAREEVVQNARIMVDSALSARAYTAEHIKPLLADQMTERFLPETVSAYAASQIFMSLRDKYPDYTYKEAALNPRNQANRASDWESDIVQQFRNHPDRRELVVVRETPSGQMLHLARPLVVNDSGCLGCHGTVDAAPKPMTDIYGTANGFGWQLHEVVAAQVVTVPMSVPLARARGALTTFVMLLGGVFVLVLVLLNVLLHYVVIEPVVRMAAIATDVSMGKPDVPDYLLRGGDEIASLSQSFHRMRLSLEKAMKMLGE